MKYGIGDGTGKAVLDRRTVEIRSRGRVRRRVVPMLVAVTGVFGALGFAAAPASAAQTCNSPKNSNVCFSIDRISNGNFAVHVGIDVHIGQEEAQEYIDDFGDPFRVVIQGDDGHLAEVLFSVPLTKLGASSEFGLSGDFDVVVPAIRLDEDKRERDEVRAVISLIDADTNNIDEVYVSNRIDGNWP